MDATISINQAPQFRALIQTSEGDLFDKASDLATQQELTAQGIDASPISYTIYKSTRTLAPYDLSSATLSPVEGYTNVEISASALIAPADVTADSLGYNFQFIPENRTSRAFTTTGFYLIEFTLYPKNGGAVVWSNTIEVKA